MRLSWSMKRRIERWKIRHAKINEWVVFYKEEIIKDYNRMKSFLQKLNKKKVKKMKIDNKKKQTIFFDSKEYIGLTMQKGNITLIEKPPLSVISFKEEKTITPTWSPHDKNCDCEDCLETLLNTLKFKFDTENDE